MMFHEINCTIFTLFYRVKYGGDVYAPVTIVLDLSQQQAPINSSTRLWWFAFFLQAECMCLSVPVCLFVQRKASVNFSAKGLRAFRDAYRNSLVF